MTTPQIVNAGNEPAHQDVVQEETKIDFATGHIESSSALRQDRSLAVPTVSQRMPTNTLVDTVLRYTEIANLTLSQANSAATLVTSYDVWKLFLANGLVADKVRNFSLIRATLDLLIVSAFPGNCHGCYVATCYPTSACAESPFTFTDNLPYATCMQTDHHVRIDCASSENLTLELPFLWNYDYASIATMASKGQWTLAIWCMSPVGTSIPSGITQGTVQVYARLKEDYELCVPIMQGKNRGIKVNAAALAAPKMEGKISGMADAITGITSKLEGVPFIGPYATVATGVVDKIGDVASWFGFTREDKEETPTTILNRPFSNPAHIDSMDTSDITSLSLTNSLSIDPRFVGATSPEDPLAYESLFKRWTFIQSATWSPGQASGATVMSFYVSPFYASGTINATSCTVDLTTAGYIGLPFNFWRGDMEYMVVIPVSKLHRGTVQIFWVPFGSTASAVPTNISLNMIYDVSADRDKQFVVGYARDAPYLRTCVIPNNATVIAPVGYTNGQIVVRVVNPLTSQSATDSVMVNIFARAAGNMDFQMPATHIPFLDSTGLQQTSINGVANSYQGNGGADGDGETNEEELEVLVPPSGDYPADAINFGERIRSVRPLMQKFGYLQATWSMGSSTYSFVNQHISAPTPSLTCNINLPLHYALMFFGLAASTRYKLLDAAINNLFAAFPIVPTLTGGATVDTISPLASYQTGSNAGAEFKIPYYSNMKWLGTRCVYSDAYHAPEADVIVHTTLAGANALYPRILFAYGPDIRVAMFNHIPTIHLSSASQPAAPPGGMV